jgi:hypothetical protein
MSEYFRTQNTVVAFDGVTLTSAFTGNQATIASGGMSKISIDLDYARGGGESSSELEIKLEASPDGGANWHSLVIDNTGATSVITERIWQVENTAKLNFLVDIAYRDMRISVRETGVVTNAGTLTLSYTLSGL